MLRTADFSSILISSDFALVDTVAAVFSVERGWAGWYSILRTIVRRNE